MSLMLIIRRYKINREVKLMKKLFAYLLAGVALVASSAAYTGCIMIVFDEPEAPACMKD